MHQLQQTLETPCLTSAAINSLCYTAIFTALWGKDTV